MEFSIFKPSPLFKELVILNLIMNNKNITQRDIAEKACVSLAMVNEYLNQYEKKGFIKRKYYTKKIVEYLITIKGKNRIKLLNIKYMQSSINVFNEAKKEMTSFLAEVQKKYENVLFYGAGDIASTALFVIDSSPDLNLNVLAIVDDDECKQDNELAGRKIINFEDIDNYQYECIVVSTYDHNKDIYNKLINNNFDKNKIVQFFE